MAFRKTSVAVEPPTPVDLPAPAVGEIRDDGKVWDGGKWIPQDEWKAREMDQGAT